MGERGAQAGNDNATRGKEFRQSLTRAMANKSAGKGWRAKLDEIAEKLVDAAMERESWAIQEIANRIDGKPAQAVELSGSLVTELTREQMIAKLSAIHRAAIGVDDNGTGGGSVGVDGSPAGK